MVPASRDPKDVGLCLYVLSRVVQDTVPSFRGPFAASCDDDSSQSSSTDSDDSTPTAVFRSPQDWCDPDLGYGDKDGTQGVVQASDDQVDPSEPVLPEALPLSGYRRVSPTGSLGGMLPAWSTPTAGFPGGPFASSPMTSSEEPQPQPSQLAGLSCRGLDVHGGESPGHGLSFAEEGKAAERPLVLSPLSVPWKLMSTRQPSHLMLLPGQGSVSLACPLRWPERVL